MDFCSQEILSVLDDLWFGLRHISLICLSVSDLKRSLVYLENPLYGGMFLMLLAMSLILYYITCLTDPGFVPISKYKKVGGRFITAA